MRNKSTFLCIVFGLVFSLFLTFHVDAAAKKKKGKGGGKKKTETKQNHNDDNDNPPEQQAEEQTTPPPEPTPVVKTNIVVSVEPPVRKITVLFSEGNTNTYQVSSNAKININGQPARLNDVHSGMKIEARTSPEDPKTLALLDLVDLQPQGTSNPTPSESDKASSSSQPENPSNEKPEQDDDDAM